jgi:hypothetical protein
METPDTKNNWMKNLITSFSLFLKKIGRLITFVLKTVFTSKYTFFGFKILSSIWPIILTLVIIYGFLTIMDQVRDLMDALIQDVKYSTFAFIALLILSLTTWYAVKINLVLRDQIKFAAEEKANQIKDNLNIDFVDKEGYEIRVLELFIRWIPVALGIFPFLFFLNVLQKVEDSKIHVVVCIILIIIYLFFVSTSKDNSYVNNDNRALQQNSFGDLFPLHRKSIWVIVSIAISFCALITFWYTNIIISNLLGPIAVSLLAFAIWICVSSFFSYLDHIFRIPFTLICMVLMMAMNNNNHQIRTLQPESGNGVKSYLTKNGTIPMYFGKWLESHKKNTNDSIPVYLIATEGGGIRSAYWTATVLNTLESYQKGKNGIFFNNVFAISGVSGGSMGAALYTAQYRDHLFNGRMKFCIDNYFKKDFLSPLLSALLIPDMIQKFLPIPLNQFDRAQYLEDSWSAAYRNREIQTLEDEVYADDADFEPFDTFERPFMELWKDSLRNKKFKYNIPVLFLNSTQAETGRKAVLAPLRIVGDENFNNVVDIQEEVFRHIPLKTAISMSARFPIITPPATIRVVNEPHLDGSNFVDGGYFDNSGTSTLLSILTSILSDPECVKKIKNMHVIFKIILIKNSPEIINNEPVTSLKGFYEFKGPLEAFYKSWDNSSYSKEFILREFLKGFDLNLYAKSFQEDRGSLSQNMVRDCDSLTNHIDKNLYTIALNRKTGIIPLGWDLSINAENRIIEQGKILRRELEDDPKYGGLFK